MKIFNLYFDYYINLYFFNQENNTFLGKMGHQLAIVIQWYCHHKLANFALTVILKA